MGGRETVTDYLPAHSGALPANLPSPKTLGQMLTEAIGNHVAAARAERGEVHAPEDTYGLIRGLHATDELMGDYARAFTAARSMVRDELESELMDATGEQDGMPMGNLTVPDKDGDIALTRDTSNAYDIDLGSLRAVIVALVGEVEGSAESADLAIGQLLALGTFTPQVSKVKEFARVLSRGDDDKLASVATGAIRKTTKYRGVKAVRK